MCFFNDTATTEIYTLSLHDALPIFDDLAGRVPRQLVVDDDLARHREPGQLRPHPVLQLLVLDALDRKSTRLNSSHANISYAVFCLKKKTTQPPTCTHSLIWSGSYAF